MSSSRKDTAQQTSARRRFLSGYHGLLPSRPVYDPDLNDPLPPSTKIGAGLFSGDLEDEPDATRGLSKTDGNDGLERGRKKRNAVEFGLKKRRAMRKVSRSKKACNPPKPPYPPCSGKVVLKPEQTIRLGNGSKVEIGGLRDESNVRHVWCWEGKIIVLTRYGDWHGGGANASTMLLRHGLVVVGSMSALREAVDQLKRFPNAPIVTKSGWSKYGFALPDGRVLVPDGEPGPLKSFEPVHGMLGQSGTLEEWKSEVAGPLAGHHLASFFMMMMFAASLLRLTNRADNFGFEICGEAGKGKSTLQVLIASAAGPAVGGGGGMYWRTLNATVNALESDMPWYDDMPLILDEAGLIQGGGRAEARALAMRELAFRLSAGTAKHRFGEPAAPVWRLVYMLSTNVSITSFGTAHGAESEAIADRLLTVPLQPDRPHGIFDRCPSGSLSTGEFADSLKQAAAEHYGYALPAFLQYLVGRAHRDKQSLRRAVNKRVDWFVQRCGASANDGSQKRVAEAFGLVYAAGKLAQKAGVLPDSYQPARAALAAYRLHQAHGRGAVSFEDRLSALIRHSSTIDLSQTPSATLTNDQIAACPVLLYTAKSKNRELVVPSQYIETVFTNWRAIQSEPDLRNRLRKSSDRLTRDRPVGPNGSQVSCYVFDISDLER